MTWVGLNLPKRYFTACAMSDAGVIVAEHRRLPAAGRHTSRVGVCSWSARWARD
jgi:hypothetical protein